MKQDMRTSSTQQVGEQQHNAPVTVLDTPGMKLYTVYSWNVPSSGVHTVSRMLHFLFAEHTLQL